MLIRGIQKNKGFTLIELIVSVSIIALISGVFLTNYHKYKSKSLFEGDVQYFASKLREIQNYSMSLKEYGSTPDIPDGGWGTYLWAPQPIFTVFADVDGDHMYQSGSEKYQEDIRFSPSTVISDVIMEDGGSEKKISISFQPPDPQVYICHSTGNPAGRCVHKWIIIILQDQISGATKRILINKTGMIDIIN